MKTEFEVLRRYKMHGGGIAEVTRIDSEDGESGYPVGFKVVGDLSHTEHWATLKGQYWGPVTQHCFDLLLPAIEPEGEPAGMHPKVRQALVSMADLWGAFSGDIQTGLIDPCGNGYFLLSDGARIVCGYESREAALAECRQIIESIDHLLEGRSHD